MPKISIIAPAQSGKSTLAKALIEDDNRYKILSIGNPIKAMARIFYDKPFSKNKNAVVDQVYKKIKLRYFLQKLGQWGRDLFGELVWLDIILNKNKHKYIIIDDVRTVEELRFLLTCQHDTKVILLHKKGATYKNKIYKDSTEWLPVHLIKYWKNYKKNIWLKMLKLFFKKYKDLYYILNRFSDDSKDGCIDGKIYFFEIDDCKDDIKKLKEIFKETIIKKLKE
jgi:hypothetical protein